MSCSTTLKHYDQTDPEFKLEEFFNGNLKAYGIVQNRRGDVIRRFHVDMLGEWDSQSGTLYETFYYDDGEQQQRTWQLQKVSANQYTGSAADVTRQASGQTSGFAFNWHYTLSIPIDDDNWNIDFDDWMYLLDDRRLINRATMKKWGFRVGEVTLWIEKQ
jgi:hypothetical protein